MADGGQSAERIDLPPMPLPPELPPDEHVVEEGMTVRKIGYWVTVQLDEDGTPLTMYGERMVEVRPNEWMDPLVAALVAAWPQEEGKWVNLHPADVRLVFPADGVTG